MRICRQISCAENLKKVTHPFALCSCCHVILIISTILFKLPENPGCVSRSAAGKPCAQQRTTGPPEHPANDPFFARTMKSNSHVTAEFKMLYNVDLSLRALSLIYKLMKKLFMASYPLVQCVKK